MVSCGPFGLGGFLFCRVGDRTDPNLFDRNGSSPSILTFLSQLQCQKRRWQKYAAAPGSIVDCFSLSSQLLTLHLIRIISRHDLTNQNNEDKDISRTPSNGVPETIFETFDQNGNLTSSTILTNQPLNDLHTYPPDYLLTYLSTYLSISLRTLWPLWHLIRLVTDL